MQRRQFLKATGIGFVGGVAGMGIWLTTCEHPSTSLSAMQSKLKGMLGKAISSQGVWQPGQVFAHLAQSIEYSMLGYPEMRSELFQKTVGSIAFAVFSEHGSMTHPLDEPIPGAPELDKGLDTDAQLMRLISALDTFSRHTAGLHPHFAYGALSMEEYLTAHLLHIENHLEEIQLA